MRYRRYCTRKVDKLRSVINFKYGNRTKFNKKDVVEEKSNDKRSLQIALFNAEKYWAYASEQKFVQTIKQEYVNHIKCREIESKIYCNQQIRRAYQWS